VSVHPPFTALRSIQTLLDADNIPIALGAQNCHWGDHGAFTGEVSPSMLAKLDVSYVIVGHSERRELFGETDEMVNRKVKAVFEHGMTPIMCVGETLEERESGATEAIVLRQLDAGLAGVAGRAGQIVLAYEPVWAIGTGRTATPAQAQAVHACLRQRLREAGAGDIPLLYGGSVKADNAAALFGEADIDGGLIGGASLKADEFLAIASA